MIYIAKLAHKINGSLLRYFGEKSECENHVESLECEYVYEIRPAKDIEIKNHIGEMKERRETILFNYQYASWDKCPAYRESLKRINRKIDVLKEELQNRENKKSKEPEILKAA